MQMGSDIVTFDFSPLITNTFDKTASNLITSLISSYVIQRLYMDQSPMLLFIDEMRAYLTSEIFIKMITKLLADGRKQKKTVLAALQSLSQLTEDLNPDTAESLLNHFQNFIIFPNKNIPDFDRKHLIKIGVSDSQLALLTNPEQTSRIAFVKNINHPGYFINVDLGRGIISKNLLKGLSSNSEDVARLSTHIMNFVNAERTLAQRKRTKEDELDFISGFVNQ